MWSSKRLVAVALAIALAVGQVSLAAAAPHSDPLVGAIDSISEGTDSGGNTIIIVDYTDTDGNSQTVELSVAEAESLGLITVDPITGDITIVAMAGDPIDLSGIEGLDPCVLPEDAGQPVGGALTEYFCGALGVDYDTIMGWREDGFGFGVIAQALFAAYNLGLDPSLVLEAKKSGDYSGLGLPEDADINSWGQFKKFVMSDEIKSLTNLGAIMSGRAEPLVTEAPTEETTLTTTTTLSATTQHGKSGEHGKKGEHGNGKGH